MFWQWFGECNGMAGKMFDGMSGYLALAGTIFALIAICVSPTKPKGLRGLVAGILWVIAGLVLGVWFFSVMDLMTAIANEAQKVDMACINSRRDLTTIIWFPPHS